MCNAYRQMEAGQQEAIIRKPTIFQSFEHISQGKIQPLLMEHIEQHKTEALPAMHILQAGSFLAEWFFQSCKMGATRYIVLLWTIGVAARSSTRFYQQFPPK